MNSPVDHGSRNSVPPISTGEAVINAMTVDVEDYIHVSAFARVIRRDDWDRHESRVERNTHRLLDLFDVHGVKGTFFVLGWVAQRYPALIREIAARGHEVASHGLTHELVYNQTPELFRDETRVSKLLLEDLTQKPVLGYRAASYSITTRSLWALDILGELGFCYDSSIFPVRHDRYGIPGAQVVPHEHETSSGKRIVEFPLTTKEFHGYRLPVAGGGYFRLLPYAVTRWAFRSINQREVRPFIFYLHPWEIDPGQPRIRAGRLSTFRHYNNLHRCEARLVQLMRDFHFSTVKSVLTEAGLFSSSCQGT
jgi:polysaccharide deacetylase family protein (PEP-CTERM system associated)